MSLADLIYKKRKSAAANANPANEVGAARESASKISNISISKLPGIDAENGDISKISNISISKVAEGMASIPADRAGALHDPDGGLYLPWGPCLSPDDVRRMRVDLAGMIEDIAELEGWAREHLDDVIGRAMRGPLSDLMPNLAHFTERLTAARAEHKASQAAKARSWSLEGFDGRLAGDSK